MIKNKGNQMKLRNKKLILKVMQIIKIIKIKVIMVTAKAFRGLLLKINLKLTIQFQTLILH